MAYQTPTTAGAKGMSTGYDVTAQPVIGSSINAQRRIFNFGDRIAELSPVESPFFVYGSKVSKVPTDDPMFKFLELRHQFQRRYGIVVGYKDATDGTANTIEDASGYSHVVVNVVSPYDKYGRMLYTKGTTISSSTCDETPGYFLPNQVVRIPFSDGTFANWYVYAVSTGAINSTNATLGTDTTTTLTLRSVTDSDYSGKAFAYPVTTGDQTAQCYIQIVGSAFAEGTGGPDSWSDQMYDREGYTQIFKTGIPLFSGTARATRMRGVSNEYLRVWAEKLKEHKMDIEHAFLFGVGRIDRTNNTQYTWGILPYTETYGKMYNMAYASDGYDQFLDILEDYFAPESGNSSDKLVLASRKVISWLNKLQNGFLNNTVTSNSYKLDVASVPGAFGHQVTRVNTIFGNLHFVQEPLFRNAHEDYCMCVDMKNVKFRPLAGNGENRDTFIMTNVQDNDIDGRQDLVLTEMGLEIDLPETHAIIKFA
jgi:hypothetical protein